ncbi:GTPase [Pantoea agglomerans]|uniref:GTPase n=1 Tax=Pantoea TaxID=53335 RepID=UPI00351D7F2B
MKSTKKIIVISGPSGVGKNTVINKVLKENENIKFITPFTTRKIRDGEVDSKDYYFISRDEFNNNYVNNNIYDWDYTLSNYYGFFCKDISSSSTLLITHSLAKMALRMKTSDPEIFKTIFIGTGDFNIYEKRIFKRDEQENDLDERKIHGENELVHRDLFDFYFNTDDADKITQLLIDLINKKN